MKILSKAGFISVSSLALFGILGCINTPKPPPQWRLSSCQICEQEAWHQIGDPSTLCYICNELLDEAIKGDARAAEILWKREAGHEH